MFDWLKKKNKDNKGKMELKVLKMHCVSCAMNIDAELEELPEIYSSDTSYARGTTVIEYDKDKFDLKRVVKKVRDLGYDIG